MALHEQQKSDPWTRLQRIALPQTGLFHRAQALACGISPDALSHACRTGKVSRVLPRVYELTGIPSTPRRRIIAASLWAEELGAISHRAAATIWAFEGIKSSVVEVTLPRQRKSPADWLTVHRSTLDPADVELVNDVRVTTPTRTLVDLGRNVGREALELSLEDCLRRGLTSLPRLKWQLQRESRSGRPGCRALRELLEVRGEGPATESALETRFARWIRSTRLPPPVRQFPVFREGRFVARLDFAYPEDLVGIEIDSFVFHSGRNRWYRDRSRLRRLEEAGWTVLALTQEDMSDGAPDLERQIAAALGLSLF